MIRDRNLNSVKQGRKRDARMRIKIIL